MSWTRGGALAAAHRARLLEAGVDADVLAGLALREVTAPLPAWWHEQGNALYLGEGVDPPAALLRRTTTYPFSQALLVVASPLDSLDALLLGGDDATVFLGPEVSLAAGEIYCGGGSAVVLNAALRATRCAVVDARNGGAVVAAPEQLWAANVYVATDDMHRLEDLETGARLNPYGARIRLGRHVWLGRDVVVTGHVVIGDGAVVGMRSVVRGQKVAAHTAVAGTPARLIREGIAWTEEDRP